MRRGSITVVVFVGVVMATGAAVRFGSGQDDGLTWLLGPAFYLVASFLVLRVPENRVSWVLMAVTLGLGLSSFYQPGIPWAETLSFAGLFVLVLPGLGVFLPAWFPTGHPPGRRWAWLSGVGYAASAMVFASILLGLVVGDFDDGISGCETASACLEFSAVLMTLGGLVAAVISLLFRFARSRGTERQQLKLMALAFLVFGVGTGLQFGGLQGNPVAEVTFLVGALAIPAALALAISRYRLYDIDRLVSRTVSYLLVVIVLGAIFALGVVAAPNLILGDGGSAPPLVVAGSTLLVAALFNPVRRRVSRWVDRRFNRSRFDAEVVMDDFAAGLREETETEAIVDGWVDVVAETMQPASVGVWTKSGQ